MYSLIADDREQWKPFLFYHTGSFIILGVGGWGGGEEEGGGGGEKRFVSPLRPINM